MIIIQRHTNIISMTLLLFKQNFLYKNLNEVKYLPTVEQVKLSAGSYTIAFHKVFK